MGAIRESGGHRATSVGGMVCLLLLSWIAFAPLGQARPWKPAMKQLAIDYATIVDGRNAQDIRIIYWIAPPTQDRGPAADLADKYVIIGVARGHISLEGSVTFDAIDNLQVKDASARPLHLLTGEEIPPLVAGVVAAMESVFGQTLGAFGKGMHWFVFAGGSVHACGNGGVSIPFAGETYTYDTPFPGCPHA
jgi:hypothetical protein